MKLKLESRLPGEISITSDMQITTTLMAENEEELKSLSMKVEKESGKKKIGLKLNIQKTKIMTSSPIISWQTDGGEMETMKDFIFLGFKITMDSDAAMKLKDSCSLEEEL